MITASSNLFGSESIRKFGDPFLLPSSESFPKDIRSTLDLCLFLYGMNRLYGAVVNRLVSYFITDIAFDGDGNKEDQDRMRSMLVDTLKIFSKMQQAGVEWGIYGNAFVRCVEPFDRWLVDDRNDRYNVIALSAYPPGHVRYNWESLTYTVPDLNATRDKSLEGISIADLPTVELKFVDRPAPAPDRISIVFLDPRFVSLDKAHHSDAIEYIYTIPPDMESRIKSNVLHEINNTPRSLLEAVKHNRDFKFHAGEVYHMKAPTPTGLSDSGWGCPEILLHYHSLYQIQIYRKADFAVAQDYLTPFRLFTPNFGNNIGDSVLTLLMSQWKNEMKDMISARRKDATAIHATGLPVNYQEFSGNGKNFATHDLVNIHIEALFDGLGMPRELFRGTMTIEQSPGALRMFERSYEWLYQSLDGMVDFITRTATRFMDVRDMKISLKRPSMAYNAEWMQLKLQMAANREIPRADVYGEMGISDPAGAAVRAAREDQDIQRRTNELAIKFEKEKTQGSMADVAMAAAEQSVQQGGGAPAPGGAPAGGGGGLDYSVDVGADPLQIQQRAQDIASQWLQMHAQQPNSHRKEMQNAEAINPTLYAAAKQAMEKMRSQAESQGRQSAGQQ
jgi:hypothetical protein